MPQYIATTYSMGRSIKSVRIDAVNFDDARREAERLLPTAHALPGTSPRAGAKSRVIGIRYA